MSGRGPFGNNNFGTDFFFGDAFSHMDRMMSSMLNDPFFANSMGVGFRPYGANLPYQNQDSRVGQLWRGLGFPQEFRACMFACAGTATCDRGGR